MSQRRLLKVFAALGSFVIICNSPVMAVMSLTDGMSQSPQLFVAHILHLVRQAHTPAYLHL